MPGVTACIKTSDNEREVDDQKRAVMELAGKNNPVINDFREMHRRKKGQNTGDITARLRGNS
jgi:hypothetical protein